LNVGTTSAMLSDASSGAFSANVNVTEDSCCATALAITSELNCIAGVGCTTAVDDAIAVVADAISAADASVTPTFLAVSPAACALALVVTPVSTDTVHTAAAASVDVPAVRVSVDVAVPELALVAVNVVEPQPLNILGDARVPRVNVGSTSAMESAAFSGAFSANLNDVDDSVNACGFASVRILMLSADTFTSVDMPIAPAPILLTDARVTAAVRLTKSAT